MERFKQWLGKIPTKTLLIIYIVLLSVSPFLSFLLIIWGNSLAAIALGIPYTFCTILLIIRFISYLKSKGSGLYHVFRLFFCYALFCFFVVLDLQLGLNGFLMIPGCTLEVGLLIYLYVRYRMKQWKKESSYSFENLYGGLSAGREIEFTYDNVRYLFIPENGRYYFKRIVSIDPYEYEILAEAENALACVEASAVNGKKIAGLWPAVEDVTVY